VTHDANGNVTADGPAGYTWNSRGQLTNLTSGARSAQFGYDAVGRRSSATVDGTSTGYVYDGSQVVQELAGSSPQANLLTGGHLNEVFARGSSGGTQSYLADALGSTMALTDSLGTVQTT
jgi:YD repeat-containing protein